jgi:hypothetical protein
MGNEVEIGRCRFTRNTNGSIAPVVIRTSHITANSRISAKLASSSGNDNATISVFYHYS